MPEFGWTVKSGTQESECRGAFEEVELADAAVCHENVVVASRLIIVRLGFVQGPLDDTLGDGLLVLEPALAQAGDDVGQCRFE